MRRRNDPIRKGVSLWMTLMMLALSVAVPAMERGEFAGTPVVESEHDPGSCPVGHDHTVCTQVGANGVAPSRTAHLRAEHGTLRATTPTAEVGHLAAPLAEGHPTRAPPTD